MGQISKKIFHATNYGGYCNTNTLEKMEKKTVRFLSHANTAFKANTCIVQNGSRIFV